MLEQLDIRNLALIEDIHIDFHPGFNILSGETGAGKSIILGALELLLGEKAEGSIVRTGANEASVSATVSIESPGSLSGWLVDRGVEPDGASVLIHRVVKNSGRGGIYVQGVPMTRADLGVIGDALFDMHGQHEHQSLLHNDRQRRVLDRFAGLEEALDIYAIDYRKLEDARREHGQLVQAHAAAMKEEDYLRFVAEELQRADLKPDEDTLLEDEISVLGQFEFIQENLELAHESLKGSAGGEGAIRTLGSALQGCRRAAKGDQSLESLCSRLEISLIEIQDVAESIREKLSSMSFSQDRLDSLQSRLALLQRLKKKYGPSLGAVIACYDETKAKLSRTEQDDEELEHLRDMIAKLEATVIEKACEITKQRKRAAAQLQSLIAGRLTHLGMPHVVFTISVGDRERTIHGMDQVEFLFSANLGEPLKSLKEIASGGELSRVMLAVKTVLAESDEVETLVFDEVDAGIGGAVALAVGAQMSELSRSRQVIAITHLASIAAKADRHLVVRKETDSGRTYTRINEVTGSQRVNELARMLSGDGEDETAQAHARSLML